MTEPIITQIRFYPIRPRNGHIGFVSFIYDQGIVLRDIAVYKLRTPEEGRWYRLLYPKNNITQKNTYHPIKETTSKKIDQEINTYLIALLAPGGRNDNPNME